MTGIGILVGFVVSTIGLSLFIYGRRQVRLPQLVVGVALMVVPLLAPSPLWTLALAGTLVVGLLFGLRAGYWA